jgi:cell division protein ZapA
MAGLMLADELHEVRLGNPVASPVAASASTDGVAEALNAVAARLEKIAQGL